ncbi:cytochrome P450 [Dendrothele bispora CBS 962.96]|uniref:Cytochrome P450 n=1 Tax=Dendrothele bispora (strain CBS 962.96) TaxID=1314807 RepID=A0A4S8M900_DENBC|nr:cytochrome P450 [Dendrothele bispora CBS 962.96]
MELLAETNKFWVLLSIFTFVQHIGYVQRALKGKLPPGPRGLPIVGNLFQISADAWKEFAQWKEEYGPIVYINLAGKDMVILNSHKAATDLLDRRALIYSDRTRNIVAFEILTRGLLFVLKDCNDSWRAMRRAAHEGLHKGIAKDYFPILQNEAIHLVDAMLRDASLWENHLRGATASAIMSLIYDTPMIKDEKEPSVAYIYGFVTRLTRAAFPGAHYVELFTWMKYLPSFMAPWKKDAEDWYKKDEVVFKGLFNEVRKRVTAGDERPSFCATIIKDKLNEFNDVEAAYLAGTIYAGGADTSSAALAWFMHAMLLNPEVQRKAHEELDTVVGRSRMPMFSDYDQLPYIRGIVNETLRLRPISPLGVPHRSTEDDWYEGYYIPKGTAVIANILSIHHDPEIYGPDATEFKPERHIVNGRPAPAMADGNGRDVAFGFGRRICVGRYVANYELFIDIACILWACHILPVKDSNGKPVLPVNDDEVNYGLVVRPVPFDCVTVPRFPEVPAILAATKETHGI